MPTRRSPASDTPPDADATYREVRGLVRGLDVLRALNTQPGGMASVTALADATGLHRTTVKRLLATLEAQALVCREPGSSVYALTFEVQRLSEGYAASDWIARFAQPLMRQQLRALSWPGDLATPDQACMVVRASTHPHSALSQHRSTIGFKLPMLMTAMGRAWLAHCSDDEREACLRLLRERDDAEGELARDAPRLQRLLAQVRQRGVATNTGEWATQPDVTAIACPIVVDGRAVAAINLVAMRAAIEPATLVRRYAPPLRQLAGQIAQAIQADAPPAIGAGTAAP